MPQIYYKPVAFLSYRKALSILYDLSGNVSKSYSYTLYNKGYLGVIFFEIKGDLIFVG